MVMGTLYEDELNEMIPIKPFFYQWLEIIVVKINIK